MSPSSAPNLQRSSEFAYSGDYSLKLTKENPFGFECKFKEVKSCEKFIISVW